MNSLHRFLVIGLLFTTGCAEPGCVRIIGATPLLTEPVDTAPPVSSGQAGILQPGEYEILDEDYHKDYAMLEVRAGERRGYVLGDDRTVDCKL